MNVVHQKVIVIIIVAVEAIQNIINLVEVKNDGMMIAAIATILQKNTGKYIISESMISFISYILFIL